jgi:hypothetical protein
MRLFPRAKPGREVSEDLTKLYSMLIGQGLIKDTGVNDYHRYRMDEVYRITSAGLEREKELFDRHRLVTKRLVEELKKDYRSNMAHMTSLAVLTRHDLECPGCAG